MNFSCRSAHRLGLFFVIWFAICFAWYYLHPVEQDLHMRMFMLSFFRFTGMNAMSFVSGVIQSYLWGHIAIITWVLVCKISYLGK